VHLAEFTLRGKKEHALNMLRELRERRVMDIEEKTDVRKQNQQYVLPLEDRLVDSV
jgi:hypothetical protein